jgi:hypothetical protein
MESKTTEFASAKSMFYSENGFKKLFRNVEQIRSNISI